MFAGLIVFLLFGFPVAFSLGACGLFFGFIGIELGILPESLLQTAACGIFGIMKNETLLAIPFFTVDGADPRTKWHGRGFARHHWSVVRPGTWRSLPSP